MTHKQIIAATIALAALGLSNSASAHPRLLQTSPPANATITAPSRIALRFSEKLIAPVSGGELVATAVTGHPNMSPTKIMLGSALANNGKTLVLSSKRPLAPGSYRLNWHVVSIDTHRVQGSLSFKVK